MDEDVVVRAVVQKIVKGKHGFYAVATTEKVDGSITFSFGRQCWKEKERPEKGIHVALNDLRMKRSGWRAHKARFWRPSDEQENQQQSKGEESMPEVIDKTGKVNKSLIPLKQIDYKAELAGSFAEVTSVQEYVNEATSPLEAVYVFPMPDDASITRCVMRIGKRKIEATLEKKEQARKKYDEAIQQGHHASLLEQERPNIFTMNVGGIEPAENIKVRITYVQRVPWQAGGGRFRLPLVVAPQFIPGQPTGKQAGGWAEDTDHVPDASRITPQVAKQGAPYSASITISFAPGFRAKVSCPSHPGLINEQTVAKDETAELKNGKIRTDRDFTLVYQSLSKVPEVAAHTGSFNGEKFLLASIIPPGAVKPVGSDVVMVLDCSGSMSGPSIQGLKMIAKQIVCKLRDENVGHRVGIVPFDDGPWPAYPIIEISEATESFIDGLSARGGTNLGLGLEAGEKMLVSSVRPKVMLMVTDGDTEHGKNWYGNGIRLIAVGISSAINDTRINELVRRNSGTAESVYPGEDYSAVASRLAGYLSGPVLSDVRVEADGDVVGVSDVFEGRPATIAVRFNNGTGKAVVAGRNPEGKEVSWSLSIAGAADCKFAPQLWAREFIRENPEEAEKQIATSLRYGVVCLHTAFVAISLKEVPGQKPERVEIPVNLPAGWDYEAVFGQDINHLAALHGLPASQTSGLTGGGRRLSAVSRAHGLLHEHGIGGPSLIEEISLPKGPRGSRQPRIPDLSTFPEVPTSPGAPTSFTLDAQDPVDQLIAVLIALESGNDTGAREAFKEIGKKLKTAKLDEERKAMAFYFACRLIPYGFNLNSDVMANLSVRPKAAVAQAWYNLACREQGQMADAVDVPETHDAASYLVWKFGQGSRPTHPKWSPVP